MIYFDSAATTLQKPPQVTRAMAFAMARYANPGRSGHLPARRAEEAVYRCREKLGQMFQIAPERVCFTQNATHGLNIAIHTLVRPGDRVVISGYEHNAVTRPLNLRNAEIVVAGRELFQPEKAVEEFRAAMTQNTKAVILNHVSNVFGYVQPLKEIAALCRERGIPLIVDASQSAGHLPLSMEQLGAAFIAMPGHKGLFGPQGTGVLLCGMQPEPLLAGGTGSRSQSQEMPDFLPDRIEAGTLNVPGICGLSAGVDYVNQLGMDRIREGEHRLAKRLVRGLKKQGFTVFSSDICGSGVVSFLVPGVDCEEIGQRLAARGIAVRAGYHCAPLAHESAGTADTGTVRLSLSVRNTPQEAEEFLKVIR